MNFAFLFTLMKNKNKKINTLLCNFSFSFLRETTIKKERILSLTNSIWNKMKNFKNCKHSLTSDFGGNDCEKESWLPLYTYEATSTKKEINIKKNKSFLSM